MLPITDAVYSSYQHPRDKSVFRSAREYIHQSDFKSILDVGCATGDFLLLLNSPNHYSLSGVDVSSQLIDIARKRLPTSVSLTTCDFFDKKNYSHQNFLYDVVTCFAVSGYFSSEQDFLTPLILSCAPNSLLLISGLFNMNGLTVQTSYKRTTDVSFSPGLNQLNYDIVANILDSHGFSVKNVPVVVNENLAYNKEYPHRAYSVNLNGYSLMNGANLLLSDYLIVAQR